MLGTKKVRLLRSVRLNGEHAEQGSVHDLPLEEADWLIAQGSAEPLGVVARLLDRMMTPTHGDPRSPRRGEQQ